MSADGDFFARRMAPAVQYRIELQSKFVAELFKDFEANGGEAIARCRKQKPDKYLAIIAGLMPKQVEQSAPLEGVTDDDISRFVAAVRARLHDFADGVGSRDAAQAIAAPLVQLPALPQAGGIP